ncbi:hypothetical protein AB4189_22915 [Vibrio sp. 10N.286.49.E1]|uniref:Ig-like domain-containing protein n=1 Tax=Vibrio tasmaniensis 1F-267 TaxID=1191324 RepID=A0ABX3B4X5_9VIBR|nr:hypothetical protein [Vibrio tasmaniensis]OEF47386.1 hypothetical protein A163_21680 [Vibrio tasmaniensis 1F-267]
MKKLYFALLAIPFALLGCGGESSGSSTPSNDRPVEKEPVVYTQDGIVRTYTEQKLSIDLSERNSISNSEALLIDDITNVTGNSQCDPAAVSGMTFELDAFDNPTMCQYQYSLRSVESGTTFANPRMVTSVLVEKRTMIMPNSLASLYSLPSTTLPPTTAFISTPGRVINIDLKAQLASIFPTDSEDNDYVLSSTILVLGSGSAKAISSDEKWSIVEYNSDANDPGGITRLIYSLSDDFDGDGVGDFKVGAIDISISSSDDNSNPETKYFQWTNNGSAIKVGQKYTIDVASDISAECTYGRESHDTQGSCIYDADNDALQLVGAYSYDATVAPTNLTQLDSTEFDVTFGRAGWHDISYQVSDHYGGFATGIVRVYVKENIAPILNDSLYIWYTTAGTDMSIGAAALATDIDGDTVTFKSITMPPASSDKLKVEISTDKSKLQVAALADVVGTYFFDVVLTDGEADITQHWAVVANSASHLFLKDEVERTFSTNTNIPIMIDIPSLVDGYLSDEERANAEVVGFSFALLGTVEIFDSHNVIYRPNENAIGVDDFIFEVRTELGGHIYGNVNIYLGNPPVLEIAEIDATEGENDLITASVICEYCDVSQYEYRWIIDGELVSTDKSFTITPGQRPHSVTLFVSGFDVFGQSVVSVRSFDFFKITVGTFASPAESCNAIFNEYNSKYSLVVDDGEYWINGATGKYKTQCDMVTIPQSLSQSKMSPGGYTLIWSYSERTNLTRFGGNNTVFSQDGKGLRWGTSSQFSEGIGLVSDDDTSVNYNNFRISAGEAARLNNRHIRLNYTSDPSVNTIDKDTDDVVLNWQIETTSPDGYSLVGRNLDGGTYGLNGIGFKGRVHGLGFELTPANPMLIYFNGEIANSAVNYAFVRQSSSWAWHIWTWVPMATSSFSLGVALDTVFGGWNATLHDEADLFGKCTSPEFITILSVRALGCNGRNGGAMTYHENINHNEGYVMQWWVK